MEKELVIAEGEDFRYDKAYLRQMLFYMVQSFLEAGGQITVCRPAFAYGCETPSCVRQAVRKGWK